MRTASSRAATGPGPVAGEADRRTIGTVGSSGYRWTSFRLARQLGRTTTTQCALWKGDQGRVARMAAPLARLGNIVAGAARPWSSVDFVTAHDGFTLHGPRFVQRQRRQGERRRRPGRPFRRCRGPTASRPARCRHRRVARPAERDLLATLLWRGRAEMLVAATSRRAAGQQQRLSRQHHQFDRFDITDGTALIEYVRGSSRCASPSRSCAGRFLRRIRPGPRH